MSQNITNIVDVAWNETTDERLGERLTYIHVHPRGSRMVPTPIPDRGLLVVEPVCKSCFKLYLSRSVPTRSADTVSAMRTDTLIRGTTSLPLMISKAVISESIGIGIKLLSCSGCKFEITPEPNLPFRGFPQERRT